MAILLKFADLPEKITDIDSEQILINVLCYIMHCGDYVKCAFKVQGGFIYKYFIAQSAELLLCMPLSKIEELYAQYRRIMQKTPWLKMRADFDNDVSPYGNQPYFMFKGSFNILTDIVLSNNYEYDDLIILPGPHDTHIIQTDSGYYYVPCQASKTKYQFEPIKSNYKFRKLMKAPSNGFFNYKYPEYRYAIDPFDANVSFVCFDTGDIINPETGKRVKTLPMISLTYGPWVVIEKAMVEASIQPIPEIYNDDHLILLKNIELNFYILVFLTYDLIYEVHELRFISSGGLTKSAVATE